MFFSGAILGELCRESSIFITVVLLAIINIQYISTTESENGNSLNHHNEDGESSLNSIKNDLISSPYLHVPCGTIATNTTHILVKNPSHPEPVYMKSICETVVEKANPSINKLSLNFKQLELYRPTIDGSCMHDRFAVYTDLNAPLSPIMCGNHTGQSITVPFPVQTSVIVSIITSDLDHDRFWVIEIQQKS